jgi:hypothetical protein
MEWLCERAILTPKNNQAAAINDTLLSFEGEENIYTYDRYGGGQRRRCN